MCGASRSTGGGKEIVALDDAFEQLSPRAASDADSEESSDAGADSCSVFEVEVSPLSAREDNGWFSDAI